MSIGDVAGRVGVTTRTLRYYEEVGLVTPSARTSGGTRRYTERDRARVQRIRELQTAMGFNLEEIRELLDAGDRIERLRVELDGGVSQARAVQIIREAGRLNSRTQARVVAKIGVLEAYLGELRDDASSHGVVARERGLELLVDRPAT